jgi:hypothetical protein
MIAKLLNSQLTAVTNIKTLNFINYKLRKNTICVLTMLSFPSSGIVVKL